MPTAVLTDQNGSNYGNVVYSLSKTVVMVEETFNVQCRITPKFKAYGVRIWANFASGGSVFFADSAVTTIAANTTVTLNVSCKVPTSAVVRMTARGEKLILEFQVPDTTQMFYGHTTDHIDAGLWALQSRIAPEVSAVLSDSTSAYGHFGTYVKDRSSLSVVATVTLDPYDSALTVLSRQMVVDGVVVNPITNSFSFGLLTHFGASVPWSLTITDSQNFSTTISGTIQVLDYSSPSITSFIARRCKEVVNDLGQTILEEAADGEVVDLMGVSVISGVASNNGWIAELIHGPSGGTMTTEQLTSGSDGQSFTSILVKYGISATTNYDFTYKISDYFTSAQMTVSVYKAISYFNVEKFHVAVGKRATPRTESDPLFECVYPAQFLNGLFDVAKRPVAVFEEYDAGSYSSSFAMRLGPFLIQCGLTGTMPVTGVASVDTTYQFSTPFKTGTDPKVFITKYYITGTPGNAVNSEVVLATPHDATQFTVRAYSSTSGDKIPRAQWIAIGYAPDPV